MKKPVINFVSETQLKEYGKYWQDILYLDDWIINYVITDDIEDDVLGKNKNVYMHKTALIKIIPSIPKDEYITPCAEKILIHELLHCRIEIEEANKGIVDVLYEENRHQKLEFMARSLLRAKYNLKKEWFSNVN